MVRAERANEIKRDDITIPDGNETSQSVNMTADGTESDVLRFFPGELGTFTRTVLPSFFLSSGTVTHTLQSWVSIILHCLMLRILF